MNTDFPPLTLNLKPSNLLWQILNVSPRTVTTRPTDGAKSYLKTSRCC